MNRLRIRPEHRPIVVGEDNFLTARLLTATLVKSNFTVIVGRDGDAVLSLIHRHSPGLVLLNMGIARPSGGYVLRLLHQQRPELRVLAFSGVGQPDLRQSASRYGVPYFETPFHPVELADRIRIMLTRAD